MVYLTITREGKKKRMPKSVMLFGRRQKVFKREWDLVQRLEIKDFKERKKQVRKHMM